MVKIIYSDYYLPLDRIDIQDTINAKTNFPLPNGYNSMEDFLKDFSEESKLKKIAIENKKDLVQIFAQLLNRFFKITGIPHSEIKYIFYTNPMNNIIKNGTSVPYCLQSMFKMDKAAVLILDQKCATSLFVLEIARALLEKDKKSYALILSPCMIDKLEDRFIHFTSCGDAAAIMTLKNNYEDKGFAIAGSRSLSDGSFSYERYRINSVKKDALIGSIDDRMKIIEKGIGVITNLLADNGLSPRDLRLLLPQSVNYYAYYIYSKLLKIPMEKIFTDNIPDGGHLGDVDLLRNFTDVVKKQEFSPGDYILLYGVGSDGTDINYNALLLHYISPEEERN